MDVTRWLTYSATPIVMLPLLPALHLQAPVRGSTAAVAGVLEGYPLSRRAQLTRQAYTPVPRGAVSD